MKEFKTRTGVPQAHFYIIYQKNHNLDDDCDLRCEAVVHDGGVVISHLTGVGEPPAVAVTVVCAVRVTTVITHGKSGSGAHPGILVELGRPRILEKNTFYVLFVNLMSVLI